jgi:rare lipoprotein A
MTGSRRATCCGAALALALVAWPVAACREPPRVEEGVASYYHDSLDGESTASEEAYSRRSYTAAHRTIPFGTRVRVTNLENGRTVWVRINDRGPHVAGRIIDLSRAAARKLRMTEGGTVRVRLEIFAVDDR